MRLRQQTIFFVTNFILFFTGNGLYPLLPLFAGEFGASPAVIGIFLASLSATNAVGALLAGRLLSRFAPRTLYVGVSASGVVGLLILTQAGSLWLAAVATALLWFVGGFVMALGNVLTGLAVAPQERGRAFSLLYLASPIAAIFGGGALGAIVGGLGYTPGFLLLAVMWAAIPVLGMNLAGGPLPQSALPVAQTDDERPAALGGSFILLLVSALAVAAAIQARNVAAFLQMQQAGFSPGAISSTTVAAGVVTIPVAVYAGSLSDRIGRRALMMGTTALVALTLVPLALANELWHFASGLALLLAATAVLRPATTAIATDLLPPAALQRGIPLIEAALMGIGIPATAIAGFVLEGFGAVGVTVLSISLLAFSGIALALLCTQRLVGAVCPTGVGNLIFWRRTATTG